MSQILRGTRTHKPPKSTDTGAPPTPDSPVVGASQTRSRPAPSGGRAEMERVFGDLDCNDNTPVLEPSLKGSAGPPDQTEQSSPTKISSMSEQLIDSMPGLPSPDDTLSNDFFYDDEFAVPFDCNLGDMEEKELMESLDLSHYMLNRDNQRWRMTSSKSDSCLYPAELTDSERDMSTSERDCLSSSEDFKSEPLFSPQPPNEEGEQLTFSNLPQDSLGPEDLTASLGKQYSYDWSANKDRYMLSFDRSPSKCSGAEDSIHETSLTTWAQKSGQSASWGSTQKNTDAAKTSPMTTWAKVKQSTSPPESEASSSGMVTWKQVKEASDEWQNPEAANRSRSLPDLKQHVKVSCTKSSSYTSGEQAPEEKLEEKPPTPLIELFQRVRSPCSEDEQSSQEACQQLMGTWSVSPISLSRHSQDESPPLISPAADTAKPNSKGLISWNTFKNLATVEDSLQPSHSLDRSRLIEQLNQLRSQHCDASFQKCMSISVQAGSALFSKDLQNMHHKAVQFPPTVSHSASQTVRRSHSLQPSDSQRRQQHVASCPNLRPSCSAPFALDVAESVQLSDAAEQRMSASSFLSSGPLPDLSFLKRKASGPTRGLSEELARVPNRVPKPKRSFSCDPRPTPLRSPPLRKSRGCRRARSTDSGSSSLSTSSSGIGSSESCCQHTRRLQEHCCCCRRTMVHSHPLCEGKRIGSCSSAMRDVNYLLVSPVHDPRQMCPHCLQYRPNSGYTRRFPLSHRSQGSYHPPLKSCLAKKVLKREALAMKHRSWSDPSDAMVLKHSQDGQIIYQLVTHCPSAATCDYKAQQLQQTPDSLERSSELPCGCIKSSSSGSSSSEQQRPSPIPVPPCSCGTTHAVLHSSEESTNINGEICKAKKSVSFSEQISYHSPGHAPPMPTPLSVEPVKRLKETTKQRPLSFPGALDSVSLRKQKTEVIAEDAPVDFQVTDGVTLSERDAAHKRGLVMAVIQGADRIMDYFSHVENQNQQVSQELLAALCGPIVSLQVALGDNLHNEAVGHLVLKHLCPALHAMLLDGLQPQVSSLLGKVRNNVWRLVLDSAQMGSANRLLNNLIQDLKSLKGLDSIWLKFNAFVFGMLNHRALDFWLTSVHHNDRLLKRHYAPDALVCCLASSEGLPLLMELTTALQPLAHLPWHLDYRLEINLSAERQQAQLISEMQSSRQSDVLHASGRQLYRRVTEHLKASSVSRPIPMLMRSSAASDVSDVSSGPPSLFHGSPTASDTGSSFSGPPSIFQASPCSSSVEAQTIMRDNKMLDSTMEKSDASSAVSLDGLLQKMSKQIKELATSDKEPYKAQEYKFEEGAASRSPVEALAQHKDIFDASGVPKDSVPRGVEFQIPKRNPPRSKSENLSLHQAASSSSSESSSASSLLARSGNALRKRWSSFGPTLIGVFDKLLLSDDSKNSQQKDSPPLQAKEEENISRALSMDAGLKQAAESSESRGSSPVNRYVKTLCHYVACEAGQLSFDKGTLLLVASEVEEDWYLCRHGDDEGLVHRACVQMMEACTSL